MRGGNDTRPLPRDYIERRVREGALDVEIARELGANAETVGRIRSRKLGLPRNYRPSPTPEALAIADRLLSERASRREVAETLGVHKETIASHFPGRAWTRQEVGAYAATLQRLRAASPDLAAGLITLRGI